MAFDLDGYPDLATLLAASSSQEIEDFDADVQAGFRSSAIRTIEAFAGQRFNQEGTLLAPVTKRANGSSRDKLWLPKRLASLSTLGIYNSGLDQSNVAIGSSSEIPEGMNDYVYVNRGATIGTWMTRVLSDERRLVFAPGTNNVSISGVWGWPEAEFPSSIADAIRFDMEDQAAAARHGLGGSIAALRTLGASSTSQGPLSVTISRATPVLSDRAMALVEPYGWSSFGAVL